MFEIPEPAEQAPQGAAGGGSQNSHQKKKGTDRTHDFSECVEK